MEFLTQRDLYKIGRDYVLSRAKKIDPAQVDVEGSNVNIFLGATSFMAQAVMRQLAEGMRATTLAATGDDLDRRVLDEFLLPRKGATTALVPLRMYRASSAAGAGSVPVGTRILTRSGIEYVTLTVGNFGASQLDGVDVDARAVQAGYAYQVGANTLNTFAQPNLLFDPTILVNNDDRAAGGNDRETDPVYAARAQRFWQSARRGVLGAIEFGATTVAGVASASASEALGPDNRPARIVNLVVADAAGTCNRVLAARVQQTELDFRAGGITVVLLNSVPQIVDISLALTFSASVDTTQLTTQIVLAVVEFVNSLGANQVLRRGDLFAVLSRYRNSGLVVTDGSIAAPTGDLVPDPGKTIRTRVENVKVL
jgi:hypothetical protein